MTAYPAKFSDGQTAAISEVDIDFDDSGLRVVGRAGGDIDHWGWDDLRLLERVSGTRPVRLTNRNRPGARLTIEDTTVMTTLKSQARYLRRDPLDRARMIKLASVAGMCIGIVAFFVFGLPRMAKPVASIVPVSWEEPVGESTVDLINRIFAGGRDLCVNPAGVAALERLTDKLREGVDTPYEFKVDVADSGLVNALAAPGGRIVIFRGLIKKAKSPGEVAGVLAHEMAHVIHRHPTQGMINTIGWSSLMSVLTGGASLSNEAVARLAAHLATSAYSRDIETEADAGALEILAEAGIASSGLANFFSTIEQQEGEGFGLPAYLSSHPRTTDRIAAIEKGGGRATTTAMSESDWKALQEICDG